MAIQIKRICGQNQKAVFKRVLIYIGNIFNYDQEQ